jgi:integrase
MPIEAQQPTVSVYTRHADKCKYKANRYSRQCTCSKWLYITGDGKDRRVSAKTRDGVTADDRAAEEQSRLRGGGAPEAPKKATVLTVEDALEQWVRSLKEPWTVATTRKYQAITNKISAWAKDNGIKRLSDVTAVSLDKWRGEWGLEADRKGDRIGPTTQNQFQGRLKAFFKWACNLGYFQRDPAACLGKIKFETEKTQPLTPEQFAQLIAATEQYDTHRRTLRPNERFGAELKAIFLIQRWTGLRILDVLMLPRKALVDGVLRLKTLKTGATVEVELPEVALMALEHVEPRPHVHKDYYFWSRTCAKETLRSKWITRIRILDEALSFTDEEGKELRFHSHMLRDTFAIELLLAGVPMEDVSRMLTHKNIGVTQKHYDPWVKRRREQLEIKRVAALKRMGATFAA